MDRSGGARNRYRDFRQCVRLELRVGSRRLGRHVPRSTGDGRAFFGILPETVAELAAALPSAGGFDGAMRRRALGPTAGYLTGMSVAIALAVGAGLAVSFSEAYVSAWLGFGGWPIKIAFLVFVMGLQLRGASEAVGLTVAVGVAALVILVAFCLFMAPEYQSARLFSVTPAGVRTLLPHGLGGAARCIPFALFLFLGVEQSAHAAAEMRDMARKDAQECSQRRSASPS